MTDASFADRSVEPSVTRHLTIAQKERLTVLLEQYLAGMEQGIPPSLGELESDDPDLAEPLRIYVSGLQDLHQIAAGFQPRGEANAETNGEGPDADERRLGDFQLFEVIGRGGMGVVHRARQISLDRTVAIKLLPLASVLDSRQIARFRNEAQAAAGLHHPHIVPVYAVGCERGVHYYAMQFIDGRSMDEVIATRRSRQEVTDWRQSARLAIEAAEALHTAHALGIVHRDIKPSNLILDGDENLWVTDFGLARCQTDVSLTRSGDVVGTMKYMSPEQARGESVLVDGRTDVYSLGVTLYEMLSLSPPYDAKDAPSILRLIDAHHVVPLGQHRPDIPRDLETVVAKAMSRSRDDRYETAQAMAEDLRRVLAGQPTVARPPTLIDHVAHWASDHRYGVAVTLMIGLLGLIGFAISTALIAAAKGESDANALRASHSEALSRSAVDRLGSQMAELLSDIPAAEPVRRRLLHETLDYYQRFAASAQDDPQLRRDLAVTYGKIGAFQAELEANEKAIASLRRSEQLFALLAQASPSDRNLSLEWSTSQNNLARALHRAGRLQEAAGWFAKAIASQQRLIDQMPEETPHRPVAALELAASLNNLGLLLGQTGATEEAETAYRRAIELLTTDGELALGFSSEPSEPLASTRHDRLAALHANLSGLLTKRSPAEAIDHARQALLTQTAALENDRSDAKLASQVALTFNLLGSAQSEADQLPAACESFERAIDVQEQLLQRWPDQAVYRRDLVISLNHLGLSLSQLNRLPEARATFERALRHQQPLAAAFARDGEVQSMLGGVLNNLGFLQQQLGESDAAIASYQNAIEHQTTAVELAPEVPQYREFLERHRHNLDAVAADPQGDI